MYKDTVYICKEVAFCRAQLGICSIKTLKDFYQTDYLFHLVPPED